MQFDNFSAFLNMGGYGFFVWISFGFAFITLLGLVIQSKVALDSTKKSILNKVNRDKKLKQAAAMHNANSSAANDKQESNS